MVAGRKAAAGIHEYLMREAEPVLAEAEKEIV
jgi:hypothetical protein